MRNPRTYRWLVVLCLLLPFPAAQGAGKHLEVMAPLCRQHDFHGKPHQVTERSFESTEGGQPRLESVEHSEYDKEGNALRIEKFDSSNRKTDSETYTYDADGTWVRLAEVSNGSQTTFEIFIDVKTKRIAKLDLKSKQTEFMSYSGRGFEVGSVTQTSTGKMVEKATITRNANDKEENVLFEEPPGKKSAEISIQWNAQGFENTSTLILHDDGGDQIISTFEYPEVDAAGNWLTQIERKVLVQKNGEKQPLAVVTVKRTITYHP